MKPSRISVHCSLHPKTIELIDEYILKMESQTMTKHFRTDVVRIAVEEFFYNSTIKGPSEYD